jgi:hypothetical protein
MKINELLVESQIDEISLGGIATGIGKGLGAVRNAFSQGADGYADKRKEYQDQRAADLAARAGKTPAPAAQDPAATTQPTSQTAPAPDDATYKQALAAIDKLDPAGKKQLAGDLQKSIAAGGAEEPTADTTPAPAPTTPAPAVEPQGSTYDPEKAAADKLAKGQADQQQAMQQMDATKQANAAKAQQDAAIKAAADAAKAKPGFQQTAADKLAIKTAADKGIREAKEKKKKFKKKLVAEFKSNFLGMMI